MSAGIAPTASPGTNFVSTEPLQPPAGSHLIRLDDATISATRDLLVVEFTGTSPDDDPASPCAMAYTYRLDRSDAALTVGVYEFRSPVAEPMPPNFGCTLVGYTRRIEIGLEPPFTGTTVHDLAGSTLFVNAPAGLVELGGLDGDWVLVQEEDLTESPTGRWSRTWTRTGDIAQGGEPGAVQLIQAFGGPVNVTGDEGPVNVEVGGGSAQLWTSARFGEFVLVWMVGETALALVANDTDFTLAELISLAESVAPLD